MSSPFLAEIRIVGFNFPPTGWATCDGQLLPISQNTALFALLGTFYGGDGKSTFALPNLKGSAPMHQGQGQGLSERFLGEMGGAEFITLLESEIPAHTHICMANAEELLPAQVKIFPEPTNTWAVPASEDAYKAGNGNTPMAFQALAPAGGSLPHNNMPPYLTLNFVIALQGVFPARN